jgi:hypothetical protein
MFETGWNLGRVEPQTATTNDKRNKKRTQEQVPYAEKKKRKLNNYKNRKQNNLKINKNREIKQLDKNNKPKKYAQSIKGEKLREHQVEQIKQLIDSKKSKLKVVFVIKMGFLNPNIFLEI